MTCERVRKLLEEYFDGTLSPERETLVEEHLYACEACREEYEELEELRELLRRTSRPVSPGEQYYQRVFHTVMASLRQQPQRGALSRLVGSLAGVVALHRSAFARSAALAATLVVGIALGLVVSGKILTEKVEKSIPPVPISLEKPTSILNANGRISLLLPAEEETPSKVVAKSTHDQPSPGEVAAKSSDAVPDGRQVAAKSALAAAPSRDTISLVANRIRNEAVLDNLQNMKLDLYRSGIEQYIPEMQKIEGVFYDIVAQDDKSDRRYLEALKEYQGAESALLSGNYLDAIKGYYQVSYKLPNSLLAFLSRFQIANLQFEVLQDYDGALSNYKKLLEGYPSHFISDEKKELILERIDLLTKTSADNWQALRLYERAQRSNPESARALYVQMIDAYPQSPLVTRAIQELVKLASANYEGAVSPEEMITTFQSLMEKYQERTLRAMLQVGVGDVLSFQLHNYPQAMVEYNRAIQIGGSSSYGSIARERIQDLYAKHEWATVRPGY
jgi:tetratricopeptide (TPR) repeat protein